jgi:hypothetical protein
MEPFKSRGYNFATTLRYIREGLPSDRRGRALARISPDTIAWVEGVVKPADMYPVEKLLEMLDAVVDAGNNDEAIAQHDLVHCGRFIANEATNTFLRLLMRVLTPELFARKLPSLYSRDHSKGAVRADVSADRLFLTMSDLKGFSYIPPLTIGWVTFTLETMGKKLLSSKVSGWSVATRNVDEATVEFTWSS